jgi:hypothetical protein
VGWVSCVNGIKIYLVMIMVAEIIQGAVAVVIFWGCVFSLILKFVGC